MLTLALALLAAAPEVDQASAPADAPASHVAVWADPTAQAWAVSSIPNAASPMLYLPVGAVISTPGGDLGVDLSLGYGGGFAIDLAVGPQIHLSGGGAAFHGFFVEPKVFFERAQPRREPIFFEDSRGPFSGGPPFQRTAFEVGLDVGYQVTFGRFYLASVLGASAGYCFNCGEENLIGALLPTVQFGQPTDHAVFGLNLSLLRIGMTF